MCVSGGGTTLVNLRERIAAGTLDARVGLVVASNQTAADAVRSKGVSEPVVVIRRKAYPDTPTFSDAVWSAVRDARCDLVCMAGFLSRLAIADDFTHKVLNIHPALLPAFGGRGMYGRRVHEAVLAHGCKVSGCTVHFADDTYDTGPILAQHCVPVHEDDSPETLAARVFEAECEAYPRAIQWLAEGRVSVTGRRVSVAAKPSP